MLQTFELLLWRRLSIELFRNGWICLRVDLLRFEWFWHVGLKGVGGQKDNSLLSTLEVERSPGCL
jgi:hypothetical protein